ncbi:MAG: 3-ketoacyl-ACP reductase [Anaerolineae bacterium]|nr:3-ketoacyl-ACP reductase [Anaerolineae bacterium]
MTKKVALVTGGGRGIGLGIASALAVGGCDLAVMDIHSDDVVIEALSELRAQGADVLYCRADVTRPDARAQALEEIKARFGRLNVLINNAGVAPRVRADILKASEESYDWVMDVNLKGPYFLTQAVANWMIAQQQASPDFEGCIINVSSTSATVASTSRGEYCISKAGVSMATQLWAARLGEYNIPVYEIRPGIIHTPMTEVVQEKYDKLIAEGLTIQKRWGYPEDIGKAVAALARGDFPYSTGQVIMVDGGMTRQRL